MNVEELLFNMYKEADVDTKKLRILIKKKYKLSDKEISNLYTKINNYQIKKYGGKIIKGTEMDFLTREECKRRAGIVRTIKYQKRKEKEKNYD